MDYEKRLAISFYKEIVSINEEHQIYIVEHIETHKLYVKKILNIFNFEIYKQLKSNPIKGTPKIIELFKDNNSLIVIEEYISGQTLEEKIKNHELTESLIYYYTIQLCSIVQQMHNYNPSPIIHRDIKPSNIIITPFDNVVLLDFNAAKFYNATAATDTVLIGTKGYAAPEQYGFGSSSPQTDIYAIGIMLKELADALTFKSTRYSAVIAKCTQFNPADRYNTIGQLKEALNNNNSDILYSLSETNEYYNPRFFESKGTGGLPKLYKFIPPGFKTKNILKIILSILGYLCVFVICLGFESESCDTIQKLWFERISLLIIFLSIIFANGNYLGIREYIPMQKNSNKHIRFIGIVLFDIIFLIAGMGIIVVFEMLFM